MDIKNSIHGLTDGNRSVHSWTEEQTECSQDFEHFLQTDPDMFGMGDGIYRLDTTEEMPYDVIDRKLNELQTSRERCEYLIRSDGVKAKNRFVHSV